MCTFGQKNQKKTFINYIHTIQNVRNKQSCISGRGASPILYSVKIRNISHETLTSPIPNILISWIRGLFDDDSSLTPPEYSCGHIFSLLINSSFHCNSQNLLFPDFPLVVCPKRNASSIKFGNRARLISIANVRPSRRFSQFRIEKSVFSL